MTQTTKNLTEIAEELRTMIRNTAPEYRYEEEFIDELATYRYPGQLTAADETELRQVYRLNANLPH